MKQLFRKLCIICLCTITLFLSFPAEINADTGPKPSVTITIEGVENQEYYATLLSLNKSTGPASAYDGTNAEYTVKDTDYPIWKAFVDYQDTDGYYFLQQFWNCTDIHTFKWGYYPPESFKILLYVPETNTFIVSDIYERYAFDSYFNFNINGQTTTPEVNKNYDYTKEITNLVIRIILTIVLEIIVAIAFKITKKDQLVYITLINVITQIGLNVLLNFVNFYKGQFAFVFYYVLLEVAIIFVEAFFYSKKLSKNTAITYALLANIFSFVLGLWLAQVVPGIF